MRKSRVILHFNRTHFTTLHRISRSAWRRIKIHGDIKTEPLHRTLRTRCHRIHSRHIKNTQNTKVVRRVKTNTFKKTPRLPNQETFSPARTRKENPIKRMAPTKILRKLFVILANPRAPRHITVTRFAATTRLPKTLLLIRAEIHIT